MADELVRTIAGTLAGRVRAALAKRKPPANLRAYDCVLRAQAALSKIGDLEEEAETRHLFEQALASDPDYPRAHAGIAIVLMRDWYRGGDSSADAIDLALEHAQKAVEIDSDDNECQETLGWMLLHRRSFDAGERHYRRALELNPNSPDELSAMGVACSYLGRPEEGIGWFELARKVDPHFDPTWYWHLLGATYFNARRYDEALAAFARNGSWPLWVQVYAVAAHALAGRIRGGARRGGEARSGRAGFLGRRYDAQGTVQGAGGPRPSGRGAAAGGAAAGAARGGHPRPDREARARSLADAERRGPSILPDGPIVPDQWRLGQARARGRAPDVRQGDRGRPGVRARLCGARQLRLQAAADGSGGRVVPDHRGLQRAGAGAAARPVRGLRGQGHGPLRGRRVRAGGRRLRAGDRARPRLLRGALLLWQALPGRGTARTGGAPVRARGGAEPQRLRRARAAGRRLSPARPHRGRAGTRRAAASSG